MSSLPRSPSSFFRARKGTRGFTLIELTMVIVMVGILAAIGFGKYRNLFEETRWAKMRATAMSMTTGSYVNYLAMKTGKPGYVQVNSTNICWTWLVAPVMTPSVFPVEDFNLRNTTENTTTDCSAAAGNEMVYCRLQTNSAPWGFMNVPVYCAR